MTDRRVYWLGAAMVAVALSGSALARWATSVSAPPESSGYVLTYLVGLAQPLPVVQQAGGWGVLLTVWTTIGVLALLGSRLAKSAEAAPGGAPPRIVIASFAVVAFALLFFSIQLSIDPYYYVEYGRLYGVFGINPYGLAAPLHTADSTLLRLQVLLHDPPFPDPYGPGFTLLAGLVARLESSLDARAQLWTWRAIGVVCAIAIGLAVGRLMRAKPQAEKARGIAAFAFSPIVLYESAIGAHNDLLMVAAAIWAFALADEYALFAGLLLGIAIAMKYVAIIALPFLIVRTARGGKATAALVALLALGLPLLCARPFAMGATEVRGIAEIGSSLSMSLNWLLALPVLHSNTAAAPLALWLPVLPVLGAITWPRAVQLGLAAAVAALTLVALVRDIKSPAASNVALPAAAMIWAMPALHPWYILWLAPCAALRGRWGRYAVWFAAVGLLGYAHEGIVPTPMNQAIFVALTLVILGLPAIAALRSPREAP